MSEINDLIFGKNPTEHIVSIEIEDDKAILFKETPSGESSIEEVPNRFWILANEALGPGWSKLNGPLYYRYGKQFLSREAYKADCKKYSTKDIFKINNDKEAFMVKDGFTYHKGLKHNEISILAFDIESNGLIKNEDSKVLIIANTLRKNGKIIKKLFAYDNYSNDGEMIKDWCNWVREMNPSLICGHNIVGFDLPFIVHVANLYNVPVCLGRNDSPIYISIFESKFRVDGSRDLHYNKCKVYGREVIDTMFLAYRYGITKNYESYGLKYLVKVEGKEKQDRVFYEADKIRENYLIPEEWIKIKEYASDDGDDALALYDLMAPAQFYFTQSVPKPFQLMTESATGSQLNSILIRGYIQQKHSLPKSSEAVDYPGAYSFGIPGIYRNVAKIDVASEYPSCILQYEIYDREKDPNAYFYKMVEFFTNERFRNKKLAEETGNKYYTGLEQSQKLGINSAYGLLGAPGLLFNSPKNAALVTEKGRDTIETAIKWASGKDATDWIGLLNEE